MNFAAGYKTVIIKVLQYLINEKITRHNNG